MNTMDTMKRWAEELDSEPPAMKCGEIPERSVTTEEDLESLRKENEKWEKELKYLKENLPKEYGLDTKTSRVVDEHYRQISNLGEWIRQNKRIIESLTLAAFVERRTLWDAYFANAKPSHVSSVWLPKNEPST
jgi:hypothetical protein